MLIKNLRIYDLNDDAPFAWDDETHAKLTEMCGEHPARPCQNQERETLGWVPVLPDSEEMVFQIRGAEAYLLKAQWSKRILPPAVVKKTLEDRLQEIERSTGEVPRGKYKRQIKDQVEIELLSKAFEKPEAAYIFILPTRNQIWCDQSSAKKCEAILSMIRRQLGSLPVEPSKWADAAPLKRWASLDLEMPEALAIGGDIKLELAIPGEGSSIITIKKEDLAEDCIQALIPDREVKEMQLKRSESASFRLLDDGSIKGISYADDIKRQYGDEENPEAQLFVILRELDETIKAIATAAI